MEARIMALADVFDALVSKRVYKEEFSYDRAFGIIEKSSGATLTRLCAERFCNVVPQIETLYNINLD